MKTILLAILIFLPIADLRAQHPLQGCITNRSAPPIGAYYWPPDTQVSVYFTRGMFTVEQRKTLLAAMSAWSATAVQTGSGVSFSYTGETDDLVACRGCLTVTRRDVHKKDQTHYAFFNPLKQSNDGLLISAWIDFDFATTSPQALQGFMAHELGHGMGLWDCTTCKKKQTIMNSFPGINSDNGLTAASGCDLEVVRQVYHLQRQVAKNIVLDDSAQEK